MPILFTTPAGLTQLLLIAGILYLGTRQYVLARNGVTVNRSYVIPLGVLCLLFGLIGFFMHLKLAFETIEVAGDISPQIVAGSIRQGYDYPILGIVGLAISYAFRFINSEMTLNQSLHEESE